MITKINFSFVAAAVTLALLLLNTPAFAQAIPAEMLATDRAEFFEGCREREDDELVCQILADCTTRHFENDMDLAMYISMREQFDAKAVANDLRTYLDQVAVICMAELETALENR
jgi:hypothetical protein